MHAGLQSNLRLNTARHAQQDGSEGTRDLLATASTSGKYHLTSLGPAGKPRYLPRRCHRFSAWVSLQTPLSLRLFRDIENPLQRVGGPATLPVVERGEHRLWAAGCWRRRPLLWQPSIQLSLSLGFDCRGS